MKDVFISKNHLLKGLHNDLKQCMKSDEKVYLFYWTQCIKDYIKRINIEEEDLVMRR